MKNIIKNLLRKLGVDKAISFFLMAKGFSFIATPLTLYLIASHFTPSEQGYYYTFGSLLGLSIFFELGLGVVITQFASHEYASLSWKDNNSLEGDSYALSRIISLIRKSLIWYSVAIGLFLIILVPSGLIFLGSKPESPTLKYVVPWILLITFFGLNTCLIPLLSAIEGCGRVPHIQQLRFLQTVTGVLCSWGIIISGGKLLASPTEYIAFLCVIIIWLIAHYRNLIKQLLFYKVEKNVQISWFREIFPMQWRIAVSWLCAYFTNYLFVPLLFAYRGSVEAGMMGMSLKISGIVFLVSMAWISTRTPYFGALIKNKHYKELDKLALKSTRRALFASITCSIAILIGLFFLIKYVPKYHDRILPLSIVGVLCFINVINMLNSAIGGYLRAHKVEPLMVPSIILAVCVGISCLISAKYFNANIMAISYAGITLFIGFSIFLYVFFRKKREWHK